MAEPHIYAPSATSAVVAIYEGEQDEDLHPGRLWWPGVAGYPVLLPEAKTGPPANWKPDEALPNLYSVFRCELFRTADVAEAWRTGEPSRYEQVMDRVANGWFRLLRRLEEPEADGAGWRIWLEWAQDYAVFDRRAYAGR